MYTYGCSTIQKFERAVTIMMTVTDTVTDMVMDMVTVMVMLTDTDTVTVTDTDTITVTVVAILFLNQRKKGGSHPIAATSFTADSVRTFCD